MAITSKQKPHRTKWQRFLLLPVVALGLGTVAAGWRKPVAEPRRSPSEAMEAAKQDAYRTAKYSVVSEGLWSRGRTGTMHLAGFAPYAKETVTQLRPGRFRCASFLTARSPTGALLRRRWQCLVLGNGGNWACEKFQQWDWEAVPPDKQSARETH